MAGAHPAGSRRAGQDRRPLVDEQIAAQQRLTMRLWATGAGMTGVAATDVQGERASSSATSRLGATKR
jgi:hypothetical protein